MKLSIGNLHVKDVLLGDVDSFADGVLTINKKAAIETELARRLCLKGVMLSDVQVVEWMDSAKPPISIEDVFKKDGTPRAGKLACTLEELDAVSGGVDRDWLTEKWQKEMEKIVLQRGQQEPEKRAPCTTRRLKKNPRLENITNQKKSKGEKTHNDLLQIE